MHGIFRISILMLVIAMLAGCGSDSSSAGNSTPQTNRNDGGGGFESQMQNLYTLPAGSTVIMLANDSVEVPAGTTVTSPDGSSTITITTRNGIFYTVVGATVRVPTDANGPALNTVTTTPAPTN
ncbi:hypothetical protein [Geomesophilobacter sediminis]|uniref:Uncharacterized protein n=1 Tax=Geomesophilobacter sediminis TaxID=2798584 RepID=A0A8J7M0I3_9BACT|nr:hypothetical protein [Geomesophilobacter sediminis]MBJ6725337.1 hypothetical protein [Geomesophilobacter sediminis]